MKLLFEMEKIRVDLTGTELEKFQPKIKISRRERRKAERNKAKMSKRKKIV
jgi:hypothetical protein